MESTEVGAVTVKPGKDEEDVWLEALEEGRLHEVDEELKKMKDPKLMTARQRALLESKTLKRKQELIRVKELELSKKASQDDQLKQMDDEAMQKKMIKATKRRQQAEEKKEKDKKETIERLLNKKSDKNELSIRNGKKKRAEIPKITYINNQTGAFLCLPNHMVTEFELFPKSTNFNSVVKSEKELVCAKPGCINRRKYSCSKSKLPCCSLECYKIVNELDPQMNYY